MPRYFFHVSDGSGERPDEIGIDLSDGREAWEQAVKAFAEMVRDGTVDVRRTCTMTVSEGGRAPLFELTFTSSPPHI